MNRCSVQQHSVSSGHREHVHKLLLLLPVFANCCFFIGFSTSNNNKNTGYFANTGIDAAADAAAAGVVVSASGSGWDCGYAVVAVVVVVVGC